MTVRPGNNFLLQAAAAVQLGSANGRTFALNNSASGILNTLRVVLVTTATVGNRLLVARALDPSGNTIAEVAENVNLTAGLTWRVTWGAGMPAFAVGQFVMTTLPVEFSIPGFASVQVFDSGNIDTTDTIQVNASMVL